MVGFNGIVGSIKEDVEMMMKGKLKGGQNLLDQMVGSGKG